MLGLILGLLQGIDSIPTHDQATYGWGLNLNFQLGGETFDSQRAFRVVPQPNDTIVATAAGGSFSLFLTASGAAYCVGSNSRGACAQGNTDVVKEPVSIHQGGLLNGKSIAQVASGARHSVFITADGQVATAGDHSKGQLGVDMDIEFSTSLLQVSFDELFADKNTKIMQAEAGEFHTLFRTSAGQVASAGSNQFGNICQPQSVVKSNTPILINLPLDVEGQSVTRISAGGFHTLILTNQGTVVVCGRHHMGQLGLQSFENQIYTPTILSSLVDENIIDVAAGLFHSIFLSDDGKIFASGLNAYGALALGNNAIVVRAPAPVDMGVPALNGKAIVAVKAGAHHSIFISSDGVLGLAGSNIQGQLFPLGTYSMSRIATVNPYLGSKVCTFVSGGDEFTLATCATNEDSIECAPGTYRDGRSCVTCPAGYMCIHSEMIQCAAGTFAPEGSWECFTCTAGSISFSDGAASCELCPAGSYSSEDGSTACTRCEAGTFNSYKGEAMCSPCPPGTEGDSERGSTSCSPCPAGTYRDETSTQCVKCRAGTYSIVVGADSLNTCTKCPIGTFSSTTGAMSKHACSTCPDGFIAQLSGSSACSNCGGKCSNSQHSMCVECELGTSDAQSGHRVTLSGSIMTILLVALVLLQDH